MPMATRSTSTMEPLIARSRWLAAAFAPCWNGSMPMEAPNDASDRRTYETAAKRFSVYLWLPTPSPQPFVHDQTSHLPGLLRLRTGIRLARRAWSRIEPMLLRPPASQLTHIMCGESSLIFAAGSPRFGAFDCSLLNSLSLPHRLTCLTSPLGSNRANLRIRLSDFSQAATCSMSF